jgi:EAL and modified HD-GYP domain-containing signal transduction protein
MELIALETGMKNKHLEFFLTGMFSSIDTLLNRNMEDIIDELPLTEDVKEALLKKDNELKKVLDIVLCYEMANWVEPGKRFIDNMANDCFVNLYIKALRWVNEVSY